MVAYFHDCQCLHDADAVVHVLVFQYEARGGHHPRPVAYVRESGHGEHSVFRALSRLAAAVSFSELAAGVFQTGSLGPDGRVALRIAGLQFYGVYNRGNGVSDTRYHAVNTARE